MEPQVKVPARVLECLIPNIQLLLFKEVWTY